MTTIQEAVLKEYASETIELYPPMNENDEVCGKRDNTIIIRNTFGTDRDIHIFQSEKNLTLVFGNWSRHFKADECGRRELLHLLHLIIEKEACVYTVFSAYAVYSVLCWRDQMYLSSDARIGLDAILENHQFLSDAANHNVKTETLTWEKEGFRVKKTNA